MNVMQVTFGKLMSEIRDSNNESLRTMAKRLNISAAFLSAIELGKKTIPLEYADKITEEYNLTKEFHDRIVDAISEANNKIKLGLEDLNDEQKDVALLFARKINNADPELLEKLRKALGEDEKN